MKTYRYIGPERLATIDHSQMPRFTISSPEDVREWIECSQTLSLDRTVTATYVVDTKDNLWITDRHYEHVSCARGEEVQAAGEVTFLVTDRIVEAIYTSNQSTGYCPEVDSWPVLAKCFQRAEIPHPESFSLALAFRKCPRCGQTNIVKNEIYECAVCEAVLDEEWNFHKV